MLLEPGPVFAPSQLVSGHCHVWAISLKIWLWGPTSMGSSLVWIKLRPLNPRKILPLQDNSKSLVQWCFQHWLKCLTHFAWTWNGPTGKETMAEVKYIPYILKSNQHLSFNRPLPTGRMIEWYQDVTDALKSDATPESYQYREAGLSRQVFAISPEHG